MKKFRKISSLALVLVLVCLCAASAFAATHSVTEEYYGTDLTMTRTVNEFDVSGTIVVDADVEVGSNMLRRVSIETWYITEENGKAVTKKWHSTVSSSVYDRTGVTTSKTWTAAEKSQYNITSLSYTNTTFKADVYAFGTTLTYNSGPCYLAYLLQVEE